MAYVYDPEQGWYDDGTGFDDPSSGPQQDNTYNDFPPTGTPQEGAGQGQVGQDPSNPSPQAPQAPHAGVLSKVFDWLKGGNGSAPGQKATDIASVLGGLSSGEKANRIVQGNFTQGYDKLMLDAQKARSENEGDALKKLNITKYLANGGYQKPSNPISPYMGSAGTLPTGSSDAQKQGAGTLEGELLKRLAPGGSYTPQPLNDYAKPGVAEQVGSWGGVAAGGLGALLGLGNPKDRQPTPQSPVIMT